MDQVAQRMNCDGLRDTSFRFPFKKGFFASATGNNVIWQSLSDPSRIASSTKRHIIQVYAIDRVTLIPMTSHNEIMKSQPLGPWWGVSFMLQSSLCLFLRHFGPKLSWDFSSFPTLFYSSFLCLVLSPNTLHTKFHLMFYFQRTQYVTSN